MHVRETSLLQTAVIRNLVVTNFCYKTTSSDGTFRIYGPIQIMEVNMTSRISVSE